MKEDRIAGGATADNLLKKINSLKLVGILYMLKFILPHFSNLSKTFQKGPFWTFFLGGSKGVLRPLLVEVAPLCLPCIMSIILCNSPRKFLNFVKSPGKVLESWLSKSSKKQLKATEIQHFYGYKRYRKIMKVLWLCAGSKLACSVLEVCNGENL